MGIKIDNNPIMHNDEPTLIDILDRQPMIKEVGDAIARCRPPQVFGIHGDWGLGKTSFLHQIQWYLTGDCPQQNQEAIASANALGIEKEKYKNVLRTVWFDAWRYQYEGVPVVALLQEMRSQLSWGHKIGGAAKRVSEIAVGGALLSIEDLTKKIGLQYSKFRDVNREWETANLAVSLPSHVLREHLQGAIRQLLPKKRRNGLTPRLAVFIDDVDRCEPEVAYRLLEGLKIYLTLDNCVFILGMNQKAIENAIGSRMPGDSGEDPSLRTAAYMEKLCQNVWQLPAIRNPGDVLRILLNKTVERENVCNWIRKVVENSPCLPPNPRRLKGLANLIGRMSQLFPQDQEFKSEDAALDEARILVVVAYIYQFHADVHIRWQAELDLYDKIYDWCRGSESDLPFLKSLALPEKIVRDNKSPTPSNSTETTYPDPRETDIFWIQPMILRLGTEVTKKQFEPYLHGGTQ